jgi:Kef-type K+ transport system membrane component KefB
VTATTLSTLVVILAVAAGAPLLADWVAPVVRMPTVVLEIGGGILVGPVLHWAHDDEIITFLANIGLATLMFLAGTEIDLPRVRPELGRAVATWGVSVALGLGLGVALSGIDGPRSGLIVGLTVTTTALGTLLPILRDRGEIATPFGTEVMAGAAVGELGPLVAVAVLLTTDRPLRTALILIGFVVLALVTARAAMRPRGTRLARVLDATLRTSGQFAVRLVVLYIAVMVWIAEDAGLDVLLGAFAAGMVFRLFSAGGGEREADLVEAKLEAIGFGFLVPIFFVVSGMRFDLDAIVDAPVLLLAIPAFLLAFIVIRGGPVFVSARGRAMHERVALTCYIATALPLVVVITGIGVQTGRLKTGTAAALVAAGMVSVLVLPLIAGRLRTPRPME